MKTNTSFSQKLQAGWTQKQLMKYYALSEAQYDRVIASLEAIKKNL